MNCIICLNGDAPSKNLICGYISKDYKVIAADGACNYLKKYNISADFIIGDFDSSCLNDANDLIKRNGKIFRFNSDKDYTDGQLALKFAIENGYNNIIIIGALGGRVDHEFENFRLLHSGINNCNITIANDDCKIFLVYDTVEIKSDIGATVSLIPYTDKVTVEFMEGFKYEARNTAFDRLNALGNSGVSNIIINENAKIKVSEGILMVFLYNNAH